MTVKTIEPLKQRDMLPLMRRTFKVTLSPRKKLTDEERAAKKAAREALIVAARAAGKEVDPDEEDDDDEGAGDGAQQTYDVSLSSEQPVDRWFGREILLHGKDNIDMSRADPESGIPLLAGHDDRSLPIGRLKNLKAKDGKLHAKLTPSKSPRGQEAATLLEEGHREMSLGYEINEYECTPGKSGEADEYRATKWTPMEGSMVSVPADSTVGVGRSAGGKLFPVNVRNAVDPHSLEVRHMDPTNAAVEKTAAQKAAAEIMRRATLHKVPTETALKWLEEGFTIERVNEEILALRSTDPVKQPAAEQLKLNEREAGNYSYTRAILQASNMAEGKRPEKSFELDIAEELERTLPKEHMRRGGLLIPTSLRGTKYGDNVRASASGARLNPAQLAALSNYLARAGGSGSIDSQTVNAIKEVVFTEYGGELIEILRNQALVVAMGARVLTGLSSPIAFPRETGDIPANWVAENSGTDVAAGNVTTDLVVLSPRTLQATTAYSRQLLVQSSVDVEAMVRSSIAAKHALAWDLAALHGTGTNSQPLGIYNQPNVLTVDFSNAAYSNSGQLLAWTGVVQMENAVASANALLGSLGFLTTPSVAARGKTTLKFPAVNGSREIWEGSILEGQMDGYTARATNQVSKLLGTGGVVAPAGTYHGLVFGNWPELLIGQFGGAMEMIVDPYSKKKQGLIEVASFQMSDVAVRHPVSFVVAINLNP